MKTKIMAIFSMMIFVAANAQAKCTVESAKRDVVTMLKLAANGYDVYLTPMQPWIPEYPNDGTYKINFAIIKSEGLAEIGAVRIDRETCQMVSSNSLSANKQ